MAQVFDAFFFNLSPCFFYDSVAVGLFFFPIKFHSFYKYPEANLNCSYRYFLEMFNGNRRHYFGHNERI